MTETSVHDLLLALAGRLDDDLLAWARELVAVGEADEAVELVTAALAAERVVLPPPVRTGLVAAARAARTDLDVERALPPAAPENGTPHRFDGDAAAGDAVVAALGALPARRLSGCTLHLTWRRTPAGSAPGPLPRAVLLVEADRDRSADLLTYLLTAELDRAGAPTSVEVFTAGSPLPAYHVAALRTAREVTRGDAGGPVPSSPTPIPVAAPPRHVDPAPPTPTALFVVPASEEPAPEAPTPVPMRPAQAGRRRRPEPDASPAAPVADPAPVDDVLTGPATDPLSGPLRQPLLAPLLDPTAQPFTPGPDVEPAVLAPVAAESPADDAEPLPADPGGSAPAGGSPDATPARPPAVTVDQPEEWEDDWRTGEWAMPPDRPAPAERPAPVERPADADVDEPRAARRHGDVDSDTAAVLGPRRSDPAVRPDGDRRDAAGTAAEPVPGRPAPDGSAPDRPAPGGQAPGGQAPDRPAPVRELRTGLPPAAPREVSLFESPTARVRPGPPPPSPPQPAQPPQPPQPPRAAPPPPSGSTRGTPPRPDGPLFGPPSEVPLFGDGPGTRAPEPPGPEAPRPGRRRRPDADEPAAPVPPDAAPPVRDPESSMLLSGTERDLLAQLQAELADRERRPRPYRRAERTNGSAHAVNGHGRGDGPDGDHPPDLVG